MRKSFAKLKFLKKLQFLRRSVKKKSYLKWLIIAGVSVTIIVIITVVLGLIPVYLGKNISH